MSVTGPPSAEPAQPSLIGEVIDGRYRITKLLGEGGMGQVYAAEHVHIEKRFAIKLLRPEIVSNAEAVQRFRQEARSSSSIGHRNIIAIEDFGALPDGRIYMAMELLNGAALNDMLVQQLPVDRLLNILIQTGHGLAAAHAKNIVHRDMKPENIFVTVGPNGEDIPKILDFGIAKVAGNDGSNHLTRTGTIFGTPFYMAPEQALGNAVDQRADIYSMGVIAYECFSGSLPFQGESFMGILTQHITTEPEPVEQRAAKAGRSLPPGLAEIIMRCMRKNPLERFGSMDELVQAFVGIYRSIAGAGMSTYMAAYPGTGQHHPLSPTTGGTPMYSPTPLPTYGSQPVPAAQTGPGMPYDPSTSYVEPKKKGHGLLIAIVLVILLGGAAAAAIVVMKTNSSPSTGAKSGNGSQVAVNVGSGNGSNAGPPTTNSGNGSQTVASSGANGSAGSSATNGSQTTATNGTGSNGSATTTAATNGSAEVGSGSAGVGSAGSGSASEATMDVFVETKPYISKFEVWEDGKKVDDDDTLTIVKGTSHHYTLKAPGFLDGTFAIDGKEKKVVVAMRYIPQKVTPTNPVDPKHPDPTRPDPTRPIPTKLDPKLEPNPKNPDQNPNRPDPNLNRPPEHQSCRDSILRQHDRKCRDEFCLHHPSNIVCDVE